MEQVTGNFDPDILSYLLRLTDNDFFSQVSEEAARAFNQHGPLTTNFERATLILMEEAGEVVEAVLALTRPNADKQLETKHAIEELAQLVATAMLLAHNLKENL